MINNQRGKEAQRNAEAVRAGHSHQLGAWLGDSLSRRAALRMKQEARSSGGRRSAMIQTALNNAGRGLIDL